MKHLLTVFQSRKFWLSFLGIISLLYIWYTTGGAMPVDDLTDNIMIIVSVLVGSFAAIDVAERLNK